jgi:uncharacterized membrane protein
MKDALVQATEWSVLLIDSIALALVLLGTIEAVVAGLRMMFSSPTGHRKRDAWLRYARWLVAALTFQLAADIIETSITTDWMAIARVGAIAVIRTFLNYFLEKDLTELREREEQDREEVRGESRRP